MSNLLFVPKKAPGPIYLKPNGAYAASPIAEDSTLYEFNGDWFYVVKDRADLNVRIATGTWLTSTNSNQRVNITSNGVTKSIPMNNLITTRVTDFYTLFQHKTQFRQNIPNWDTENVITMQGMFHGATIFNQDIGSWCVKNVDSFRNTFHSTSAFNADISSWNTESLTNTGGTFYNTKAFNIDIGLWNVKNVTDMSYMFGYSVFNQDLSGWCVSGVTDTTNFAVGTTKWTLPTPKFNNPPC